jgi:hypothetical protein
MAEQLPGCFGPYLRYAISTDFKNFASFDNKSFRLFLLVEFKDAKMAAAFAREMADDRHKDKPDIEFGPTDLNSRYATMRGSKAAIGQTTFSQWNNYVSRVELSLPVKPNVEASPERIILRDRTASAEPPTDLLIGVIDDGCPFAAAHFLKAVSGGGVSTRVRGIWDQDQDPNRVPIPVDSTTEFGERLTDFKYGLEFLRDTQSPGTGPRKMGLNDWIVAHSPSAGTIDEEGCYADAEFKSLKYRASHGAHVMDVFGGRIPLSARIGRRNPPSWRPSTDDPSGADIVFVQFAENCLRDATGVWLKSYVVEGVYYIMSFVDPSKTARVVINLSYGPTTGPHDGTAELEDALKDLVAQYDGSPGKPKLDIVLAAGNAFLTEGHVHFCRKSGQPDCISWTWRLPPDNTSLCFVEIWMKRNDAGPVNVTLTSPSGDKFFPTPPITPPPAILPPAGVDVPIPWGTDSTMWRLHVQPTIATDGLVVEHGDWTIEASNIPEHADVHAYVARTDPNMNLRTGAKLSHFADATWERTQSAAASCEYDQGRFNKAGSLVVSQGTLNGIATAKDARVHVAGGYILSDERKSSYASAGPARGGPRIGPDFALPCDESHALQGIRAGGNRSGGVFRLVGTSAAAPQLARYVGRAAIPTPINVTNPPEETGAGDLEAP